MRRKDREISGKSELEAIIKEADVCRIAFFSETAPYIVPLNFGYEWQDTLKLYFHCAQEGRKLQLLRKNNNVGFEIDTNHQLVTHEIPCKWGMKYKSIIGTGKLTEIPHKDDKIKVLNIIM